MKNIVLTRKVKIFISVLLAIFIISFAASCTSKLSASKARTAAAKGRITFASSRDGNFEIYIMNADGSGQINLTNNPAFDGTPSFSHDGKKIAFISDREGDQNIFIMNADGSGQRNLTKNPAVDGQPCFSPDGQKIAFFSKRDGNFEIYIMNADGSGQRNLTKNPAVDNFPSFSQ